MADIFISHSEVDSSIVIKIAKSLEEKNFTTWYYERDFVACATHIETTGKEIERCKAFIVLISKASLNSDYVFHELLRAVERKIKLIPILIDIKFSTLEKEKPLWSKALGFTVAINWEDNNSENTLNKLSQGIVNLFPSRSYQSALSLGASLALEISLSDLETLEAIKRHHDYIKWIQESIINTIDQSARQLGWVVQLPVPGDIIKDPDIQYQKLLKVIIPYLNDSKLRDPLIEAAFMIGICGLLLSSRDLSRSSVINDPNIRQTINSLRKSVSQFNTFISEEEIVKKASVTKDLFEYLKSILPD